VGTRRPTRKSPSEKSGGLSIFKGKMNWRVTYRAKDGGQAVEILEAENRNAVFKAIADKGISAIRVEEARCKVNPAKATKGMSKKLVVATAVALLAVAGAICIINLRKATNGTQTDAKERSKAKLAPRPAVHEVAPKTNAVSQVAAKSRDGSVEDNVPPQQRIVEMVSVITNADGSVLERFRTADGKIRSRQSAPKPIFDNASDQIIAMASAGAESGHEMPPMPMMDNADEEFMKSLEKKITISNDDSDEVKALKQNVIAIREEIRQLVSEGHSFAEVIKEHRDIVNHGVEMRKEATRMIKEFLDSGDHGAAAECLERVNETLAGMGIQKIEMPLSDEERRELVRKRRRNGN